MKFRFGKIRFPHGFLHTRNTGCNSFDQVHTGKYKGGETMRVKVRSV